MRGDQAERTERPAERRGAETGRRGTWNAENADRKIRDGRDAHLVGDRAAHARDEDYAAAVPEARHLAARSLGSEEDAVDVYVHDL